jgi:hypothetical protein
MDAKIMLERIEKVLKDPLTPDDIKMFLHSERRRWQSAAAAKDQELMDDRPKTLDGRCSSVHVTQLKEDITTTDEKKTIADRFIEFAKAQGPHREFVESLRRLARPRRRN